MVDEKQNLKETNIVWHVKLNALRMEVARNVHWHFAKNDISINEFSEDTEESGKI
jgi:hypothetical protein